MKFKKASVDSSIVINVSVFRGGMELDPESGFRKAAFAD